MFVLLKTKSLSLFIYFWIIYIFNRSSFSVITTELSPCEPSPCSYNAICTERNGVGACSCLPDYIGNPYEGCRPECVVDTDCASSLTCIQSKCQNPCPGTCGQNAECQVINHHPSCSCISGYTGNPFQYCTKFGKYFS